MPEHKTRRLGLAIKIIIWSFVPTIVILLSVAMVTFLAYQKVTQDLVIERDTQVTRLSASQLSNELKNYTELLTDITRSSNFRQEGSSRGWRALQDAANRLVVFDGGVVALDVHGNIFATSADRREALGRDWSNRPYFREIVRSLQPAYSDILPDGSQNVEVISAAVPIFGDQGELLGVLVGMFRIRASAVSAFYGGIVKQRLIESGRTYLIDGNGKVIYHVDPKRIGADFSGEPVVQRLLNGEAGASRTINLEGNDVVAGYAPVPGTTWGIVTEESWSMLTSSSQGYRQFLLLLIVAGFVIPVIFVGVGVQRITRPLNELIVAAQEVARGNFNQSIRADTGDEIEELAEQFSQMASQLQESYAQLEQRVAERTHELEALYLADEELYRHLDLDQVLQTLVNISKKILNAEKSAIIVWDRQIGKLIVRASDGFSPETLKHMIFEPGEGIVGKVAITGIPAIIEDSWETADVSTRITDPEGIRSFMHVPIKAGDQIFGVFNVAHHQPHAFSETQQRLLLALAQRASLAVENAQLYEQSQLVAAVEERQRLARELHDAVTQSLFSASLIAEVLTRLWDKNPEEGKRRLEELRHLTRGALAEMRTLLLELRPAALMEAEVHELFRHLCDAFSGRALVNVSCNLDGNCDPPAEIKIAIYRIAQETLNNIAKHAQAKNVELNLSCQGGKVVLDIFDDGRGFNPGAVPSDHLGLNIMKERAQRIGAKLEIKSVLGEGTRVRVTWDGGEKQSEAG